MPKQTKLPVTQTTSGKWRYDLPPSISPTGKRQRKTFKTQELAKLSRVADLERHHLYGIEGHSISASLAQDAAKAAKILDSWDVSLTQVAADYDARRREQNASRTFSDVWLLFRESREAKSEIHKKTLKKLGEHLDPHIGKRFICDIDHNSLRDAIKKNYKSPHRFNLALRSVSPVWTMAIKEGWASENPCKRIDQIDTGRAKIEVLTLGQCRKLLEACKDYRKDETLPEKTRVDARSAFAAFAVMLFAGVRPNETERLEWCDIDMTEGTIKVSNQKSKTDRSRYFDMPETLKSWLELVPTTERFGHIIPSNWRRIRSLVRKKAGIAGTQDLSLIHI